MVELLLKNGESREFEKVELHEGGTMFGYDREGELPKGRYPLKSIFPSGSVIEISIPEDGPYKGPKGQQILGDAKYTFDNPVPGEE